jgi:hypothetical protein
MEVQYPWWRMDKWFPPNIKTEIKVSAHTARTRGDVGSRGETRFSESADATIARGN